MMLRVVFAVILAFALSGCGPRSPEHLVVQSDRESVRIPIRDIDDGGVHFFTFNEDGRNVNFLVRTDGKGAFHAHLDACYACYRYRKGFVVEDGKLVCIACRFEYAIKDEVWDYIGACAPISIHSSVQGDQLVIGRSVLARAARYF